MAPAIVPAIIAGTFSLIATALSLWAASTANAVRREMQVRLVEPRVDAYRKLWALMDVASPSLQKELTANEREDLEAKLRTWYYSNGNGIFLSAESRALLVEAKKHLLDSNKPMKDIRGTLSKLRSQMKNDVGVYGREDLSAPPTI
jgi:hypothetical protein